MQSVATAAASASLGKPISEIEPIIYEQTHQIRTREDVHNVWELITSNQFLTPGTYEKDSRDEDSYARASIFLDIYQRITSYTNPVFKHRTLREYEMLFPAIQYEGSVGINIPVIDPFHFIRGLMSFVEFIVQNLYDRGDSSATYHDALVFDVRLKQILHDVARYMFNATKLYDLPGNRQRDSSFSPKQAGMNSHVQLYIIAHMLSMFMNRLPLPKMFDSRLLEQVEIYQVPATRVKMLSDRKYRSDLSPFFDFTLLEQTILGPSTRAFFAPTSPWLSRSIATTFHWILTNLVQKTTSSSKESRDRLDQVIRVWASLAICGETVVSVGELNHPWFQSKYRFAPGVWLVGDAKTNDKYLHQTIDYNHSFAVKLDYMSAIRTCEKKTAEVLRPFSVSYDGFYAKDGVLESDMKIGRAAVLVLNYMNQIGVTTGWIQIPEKIVQRLISDLVDPVTMGVPLTEYETDMKSPLCFPPILRFMDIPPYIERTTSFHATRKDLMLDSGISMYASAVNCRSEALRLPFQVINVSRDVYITEFEAKVSTVFPAFANHFQTDAERVLFFQNDDFESGGHHWTTTEIVLDRNPGDKRVTGIRCSVYDTNSANPDGTEERLIQQAEEMVTLLNEWKMPLSILPASTLVSSFSWEATACFRDLNFYPSQFRTKHPRTGIPGFRRVVSEHLDEFYFMIDARHLARVKETLKRTNATISDKYRERRVLESMGPIDNRRVMVNQGWVIPAFAGNGGFCVVVTFQKGGPGAENTIRFSKTAWTPDIQNTPIDPDLWTSNPRPTANELGVVEKTAESIRTDVNFCLGKFDKIQVNVPSLLSSNPDLIATVGDMRFSAAQSGTECGHATSKVLNILSTPGGNAEIITGGSFAKIRPRMAAEIFGGSPLMS